MEEGYKWCYDEVKKQIFSKANTVIAIDKNTGGTVVCKGE
jgi:hypothetical protein